MSDSNDSAGRIDTFFLAILVSALVATPFALAAAVVTYTGIGGALVPWHAPETATDVVRIFVATFDVLALAGWGPAAVWLCWMR